jgi:hypothetical protein
MKMNDTISLSELADNVELIEVGRAAIEDVLIDWRDSRLSELGRGNGFVVREEDGKDSSIIRFGPETGLVIALKAIAKHLDKKNAAGGR